MVLKYRNQLFINKIFITHFQKSNFQLFFPDSDWCKRSFYLKPIFNTFEIPDCYFVNIEWQLTRISRTEGQSFQNWREILHV